MHLGEWTEANNELTQKNGWINQTIYRRQEIMFYLII